MSDDKNEIEAILREQEEHEALPHVALVGDPIDGFEVYGPFKNYQACVGWLGTAAGLEGWAMPMHPGLAGEKKK